MGKSNVEIQLKGDWDGFDRLLGAVLSTPNATLGVGAPKTRHPGERGRKHPITHHRLAMINEYGDEGLRIPPRPIFAPAMDKHGDEYHGAIKDAFDAAVKGGDWEGPLRDLADRMVADVREEVENYGHQPPLAESTVERKGHDQPWVETSALVESLEGVVHIEASAFSTAARRFRGSKGRFTRIRG